MRFKALVRKFYQRYLLDAMSAMALGLFASLIIGLILTQLSMIPALKFLADYGEIVSASSPVVGAAIGRGHRLWPQGRAAGHVLLRRHGRARLSARRPGGGPTSPPWSARELGNLVSGKTKVDIIVVPIVSIVSGCFIATWSAPGINNAVAALQRFLEMATTLQPIPMGIIVSVVFGLALTAPISSAALAAMVFTVAEGEVMGEGLLLAAGAATAGCCAQMVGLRRGQLSGKTASPASSRRGIGTSMLQVGNILAHPAILLPPTIASAITGPLATTLFQMKNTSASAGMGTSGLVGQFGTWAGDGGGERRAV